MNGEIWFQLPPQSAVDWSIVGLIAFFVGCLLIFGILTLMDPQDRFLVLRRKLKLGKIPPFPSAVALMLAGIIGILFLLAIAATFVILFSTLNPDPNRPTPNLGVGALLTALLSAPFLIWRTLVAQWNIDLQQESHWNDKFSEASKDLAAWREVTRVVGEDGDAERVLTTREPDLVTRATAIDRLYGLIKERPSEASRIAAVLSLYVREHTVQIGDKIPDAPPVPVPENATPDELLEWARGLKVARSDLQKAVQTLGRIRDIQGVELEDNAIDLRGANLQAMDLSDLNFGKGQWQWAQMQGANLWRAQMQGTILTEAQMHGAELSSAQMQGAILVSAQMQGANLAVAQMHGAELSGAQMQGAILSSAQMQGAHLSYAQMQGAELSYAQMQGAGLSDAQMQGANLASAQMQGAEFSSAQMQGANLSLAQMQGAAFIDMYISEGEIYPHIKDAFGDGTNQIDPDLVSTGDDYWPDHWPTEILHWNDFNRAWRDWVAQNHPDVLQYLPDYVRNA